MATPEFGPDTKNAALIEMRREAMRLLASADARALAQRVAALGDLPAHDNVRRPESGLVMVRGRIGGDGAPFNLGEASVSRAAVRLASGELGFGYALGRDTEKARLIALCDALIQSEAYRDAVADRVLSPVRAEREAQEKLSRERTAATRVEFFTLVRGED
ncbi:MAG: phosphonate C-P lyase system protein PhnG [Pseudorhodoplanes sp.]|nr:phosphonate C-P lyase system protein PhnG [Pseudorhodoplanes sp.]